MAWFKRRKKEEVDVRGIDVGITMGELYVNPTKEQADARNNARIATLEIVLKELEEAGETETANYRSMKDEHTFRVLKRRLGRR